MPALTLPSTFANSFWSQDYRQGIETLYTKLEQGVVENDEIIAFVKSRAAAENELANALNAAQDAGRKGRGFNGDEGASLLMAFRGLQAESAAQGSAHRAIAKELADLVAQPFEDWAAGHRDRVHGSRNSIIDGWVKSYELAQGDVDKLKHQYLAKVRKADEAEDDAKFAPNQGIADNYTSSPRLQPRDARNPQRTPSVSERIAQRFKELQQKAVNGAVTEEKKPTERQDSTVFEDIAISEEPEEHKTKDDELPPPPPIDKGKEKAVEKPESLKSPPPMTLDLPPKDGVRLASPVPPHPPPPILLAGLALPPSAVSNLLTRAASDMNLRSIKIPIIGEYKDCFSGEDFVVWLVDHVQGLGGSLDRAEDAAKDLCEREGVLRRIGEFGNAFENNDEAYYQFRPKAFNLEAEYMKHEHGDNISSPISNLSPLADNLKKRSETMYSRVSKVLVDRSSEPPHIRARAEADAADSNYRKAVRKLDRQRLGLEERLEETLKLLQKWELDRLRAVKTVLLQYQGTLANLPSGIQPSLDRSSTLVASYQPEADLRALIERYRTGPFRPTAHVYESLTHEEADVYFGIDLRRWSEGGWNELKSGQEVKDKVPEVLLALLSGLEEAYEKLPNDSEKRKAWVYEVPLSSSHHLRENLNAVPPGQPFPDELVSKYDAPVIASTVKLWVLELDPPLGTWEGWDDIRRIYPSMGSAAVEADEKQKIQDLQTALLKLPRVHLLVLDEIVKHLKNLMITTEVEEDDEVYMTKLALSLGRSFLRPKVENEITIQDRHPILFFFDLLQNYEEILPPTIARKKRESVRKIPLRKRTAPIDMRVSRSRLSVANADTREILEEQMIARNPSMRPHSRTPSTVGTPADERKSVLSPGSETKSVSPAAEAPPPLTKPVPAQAPSPKPVGPGFDGPPMPSFKEPPPEKDDIAPPPMPKFVEPPPEDDDDGVSPRPAGTPTETPKTPVPVTVAPATPERAQSPTTPSSPTSVTSGAPADKVLADKTSTGGANLSRYGSGGAGAAANADSSRLRGPRGVRGARPQSSAVPSSPTAASGVAGLHRTNRLSYHGGSGRSASPNPNPQDYEPKKRGARTQAGAFSHAKKGVTSDAEE